MEISAKLVKELREKTGAGMMDCKKALIETGGDLEQAAEYLRKKGLMDASKKASRTAADGLIAVCLSADSKTASIVEVNAETDFVARNEEFQRFVSGVGKLAIDKACDDVEQLLQAEFPQASGTVLAELERLISIIGENMKVRRADSLKVENGVVAAYVHNSAAHHLGRIGVVVGVESSSKDSEKLMEFGKKIAMHIAAANPTYLCSKCIPQDVIQKEKEITIAQATELGKDAEIAAKMAEGKVKKFFEEVALLEQAYVIDPKIKIQDAVDAFAKEIGADVKIIGFKKFVLGEGIEKAETNFAEEVQSFVNTSN